MTDLTTSVSMSSLQDSINREEESNVRPPEIEVGVTTVYLRRNIVETEREEMDERKSTIFTYEEAQMNKDQAMFLLTEGQSSLSKAVADADSMNVDQEFRLTMLELGLADISI